MRAFTITLSLTLLIVGCAHPLVDVASAGAGPDKTGAYRFSLQADPDAPTDNAVLPLIEARLAAKGLERRDDGARYVVEVGYTSRPLGVGAYAGAAPADKTTPPDWRAAPGKPRWQVAKPEHLCAVSLRFVEAKTGAEAYRVHAAQQWTDADCAAVAPHLVDLALADIPLPPTAKR
jgi:hypothetical protein